MSGDDSLFSKLKLFVNGSATGFLQLLVAAAEKSTFKRIVACPTYPVPARTSGLAVAVRQFHDVLENPEIHLPTLLARLYVSAIPLDRRKRSGQFFTSAPVAAWALSVSPPTTKDDVWDAGSGTGVFAHAILHSHIAVRSYTGVESDPILALCGAHVLDSIRAPSSYRILYANFLLLQSSGLLSQGLRAPSFIISNPPYVRSHNLAGGSKIRLFLGTKAGIRLAPHAGSLSYFLLQAAALTSEGTPKESELLQARLLFFLPREAGGAAHVRRLREDMLRSKQWTSSEYTIPIKDTAVDRRSNALALFYVFDRNGRPEDQHAVKTKARICLGDVLRVRRGISTGCNEFFVLNDEQIRCRNLPIHRFRPVLPTRVRIAQDILSKRDWELFRRTGQRCWLLTLPPSDVDEFETPIREYLREGIRLGVHDTPTARASRAWYSIPVPAEPPDVFITYLFRGNPNFTLNEARVLHLTNILGGRFVTSIADNARQEKAIDLLNHQARQWFAEGTAGREYRGGLRKIEPRELSNLPVQLGLLDTMGIDFHTLDSERLTLFE